VGGSKTLAGVASSDIVEDNNPVAVGTDLVEMAEHELHVQVFATEGYRSTPGSGMMGFENGG